MSDPNQPPLEEVKLPLIREDLQINTGGVHDNGSAYWLLFDPLANQYFRIGWRIFRLLKFWHLINAQQVLDKANHNSTVEITEEDLLYVINFLYKNSLTKFPPKGDYQHYLELYYQSKQKTLSQVLKQYLFLRVPLINPQKFLSKTYPYIKWMFHRYWYKFIIFIAVLGVYLVSREWEVFINTFTDFMSFEGIVYFMLTSIVLKVFHELGHAYTSVHYGSKVNSFGIFFMLFIPLLYSDVLDTWRISNRRKRINIAIAGIRAELIVGVIALFLWAFLPDGNLKSAAFFTATTSLVTTLIFNSNIFAKFDGYYILMDLVRIDNLQPRAMEMGQWYLRKVLFNTPEPIPEQLPLRIQRWLFIYSIGVYFYRITIFTSIALIFYTFFIKIIGIILFTIEFISLIIIPVIKELIHWVTMRKTYLKQRRSFITIGILIILLLLAVLPISSKIKAPALVQAKTAHFIHSKQIGKIKFINIKPDEYVKKGDLLFTLGNPNFDLQENHILKKLAIAQQRINNASADIDSKKDFIINQQVKAKLEKELQNIQLQKEQLNIRAPISGLVKDIADKLTVGRWINPKLALAYIVAPQSLEIITYIDSQDLERVAIGTSAFFYPSVIDKNIRKTTATISDIQALGGSALSNHYFSSNFGGDIPTQTNLKNQEIPIKSIYRVMLKFDDSNFFNPGELEQITKGNLYIKGKKISLFKRFLDKATSVFIRESGF